MMPLPLLPLRLVHLRSRALHCLALEGGGGLGVLVMPSAAKCCSDALLSVTHNNHHYKPEKARADLLSLLSPIAGGSVQDLSLCNI